MLTVMKQKICVFAALAMLASAPPTFAQIPDTVRAEVLQRQIVSSIQDGDLDGAKSSIEALRKLDVKMPNRIELTAAKIDAAQEDYTASYQALTRYFKTATNADDGYDEAITLFAVIEPLYKAEQEDIKARRRAEREAEKARREAEREAAAAIAREEKRVRLEAEARKQGFVAYDLPVHATLVGHTDDVTDAVYSPTGNIIVTGSKDKTVKVWDAETYGLLATLPTPGCGVNSLDVSPDGTMILAACDVGPKLFLWETRDYALRWSIQGRPVDVFASALFSPDSSMIASVTRLTGLAEIRTVSDGSLVQKYDIGAWPYDIAFTTTGNRVYHLATNKRVQFDVVNSDRFDILGFNNWRTGTYDQDFTTFPHFSDEGAHAIAFGAYPNIINLYQMIAIDDPQTADEETHLSVSQRLEVPMSGNTPRHTAYLAGTEYGVLSRSDGTTHIFKIPDAGSARDSVKIDYLARFDGSQNHPAGFSPDYQFAVAGSDNNSAKVWRVRTVPYSKPVMNLGATEDRDARPLRRIPPTFPPRFLEGNHSGYCKMKFDVSPDGQPFNVSAEMCTDNVLYRESIRTVERWQYEPKIRFGKPVGRSGVETTVTYILVDDDNKRLPYPDGFSSP